MGGWLVIMGGLLGKEWWRCVGIIVDAVGFEVGFVKGGFERFRGNFLLWEFFILTH